MLLGAVTAAGTFFVLMLTDFRGLQELGFIAGTAILLVLGGDDHGLPGRPRRRRPPAAIARRRSAFRARCDWRACAFPSSTRSAGIPRTVLSSRPS